MVNNENILVKLDHNNLLYIDPNTTVNNGEIKSRNIKQEDLVMYVNLEAELIPRTKLIENNNGTNIINIGSKTFNMLKPNTPDGNFGTGWTDSFVGQTKLTDDVFTQKDTTEQSFGIESIEISIKSNFVPQITINFVDVRGKTLFNEQNDNSPYQAFFHLPWPVFHLTVKGYYGKSVRYKLHMTSFNSSFDSATGNFRSVGVFVGSTFAYLNDVPFAGVLNSPYMFMNEHVETDKTNTKDGKVEQRVVKQTRGYNILKSVFSEMKSKKIIDENFPVKTIRELITISESIDKILEKKIFGEVIDSKILGGLKDYENVLNNFDEQVKVWRDRYVNYSAKINENNVDYYPSYNNGFVLGDMNGSLELVVKNNNQEMKNSILFNNELQSNKKLKLNVSLLSNGNLDIKQFVKRRGEIDYINIQGLIDGVSKIKTDFTTQKETFENDLESKMNDVLQSEDGIGFKPTIKNIFAIILANAEVFMRLMKNTHEVAFSNSKKRTETTSGFYSDTKDKQIFPWPELSIDTKNNTKEIVYPGNPDVRERLKSGDPEMWPEVNFVEEFISVSTNKIDPLVNKENGVNSTNFLFDLRNRNKISNDLKTESFTDKLIVPFIYELYERSYNLCFKNNFDNNILNSLLNLEYDNIVNSIGEDQEIILVLKTLFESNIPEMDNLSFIDKFKYMLKSYSPYERSLYMDEWIPTTGYIKDNIGFRFNEKNDGYLYNEKIVETINTDFKKYKTDSLSELKYPYNEVGYKKSDNENVNKFFTIKNGDDFLSVEKNNSLWFDDSNVINTKDKNILNTSLFHQQLFSDFHKNTSRGKYIGSAYLFLNTLPLKNLKSEITLNGERIKLFRLFNDISGTHYIPYLMILKWGSQYHRYKTHIKTGEDIINVVDANNVVENLEYHRFFNNDANNNFVIGDDTITFDDNNIGVHPFYDGIFHQIVNGYSHYNLIEGKTSFESNLGNKTINYTGLSDSNGVKFWSSYVDNEKFNQTKKFTLLPTSGHINSQYDIDTNMTNKKLDNFRVIWEDNISVNNQSTTKISDYSKYFGLNGVNNGELSDLISTFSPQVLDKFEDVFINFCNEMEVPFNDDLKNIKYNNFQKILKEIVTVDKEDNDNIGTIKLKQKGKILLLNEELLDNGNLIRVEIGNPLDLDLDVVKSIVKGTNNFGVFNGVTNEEMKLINLYIGIDSGNYYKDFFLVNNFNVNETNIKKLRSLVLMNKYFHENNLKLKDYLTTYINNGFEKRFDHYLNMLLKKLNGLKIKNEKYKINFVDGYNNEPYKLVTYNLFKNYNDKWTSGKTINENLLIENFYFFDRANRNIGDEVYLNLSRLQDVIKNEKISLGGALNVLIEDMGFNFLPLPSYVNFYNKGQSLNGLTTMDTVNDVFGVFNEVDYIDTGTKFILQYVGNLSSKVDSNSRYYNYKDDSFNIGKVENNSLIETNLTKYGNDNIQKSNKVVSFEVSFGDIEQNMFKSINVDQSNFKNTAESLLIQEQISRSETGSGTKDIDTGLYALFNNMSYTCEVVSLGNLMIQPTMYFYLKNVPMFRGSYLITDVTHTINKEGIETKFSGPRIPTNSLPHPNDSFMSSYKTLFDKIINNNKVNNYGTPTETTEKTYMLGNTSYTTDVGNVTIIGETETKDKNKVGQTEYGVSYNGFNNEKFIQKIHFTPENTEYLRTNVIRIGSDDFPIDEKKIGLLNMLPLSHSVTNQNGEHGMKWSDVKKINKTQPFYCLNINNKNPEDILKYVTEIYNPRTGKKVYLNPQYKLDSTKPDFTINGVIDNIMVNQNYGMGMSEELCRILNITNGDIVYFKHSKK